MTSPLAGYAWYDKVAGIFDAKGVPESVWGSILKVESKGDPKALGDNGESFGLFQIHTTGGLGDAYRNNTAALYDPETNARIAADAMAPVYQAAVGKGLSGYSLTQYVASHAGWPLKTGNMPASYNTALMKQYGSYNPATGGGALPVAVSTGSRTPLREALYQLSLIEATNVSLLSAGESAKKIGVMIALSLLGLILLVVGLVAFVGVAQTTQIAAKIALPGKGKLIDAAANIAEGGSANG